MAAVNLARFAEQPLRIVIVNSGRPLGRGVAYGAKRPEHLLNVAARNMSAFPDQPEHFVNWLRSRHEFNEVPEAELRESFIPRRVYGDYVRALAESYLHPVDSRSPVKIEVIEDQAVDLIANDDAETGGSVVMKSGDSIAARSVLLATGNQPPASFPSESPLSHDSRYCSDPWGDWTSRLPAPGGRVVLLGTGLTMVDVLITLGELNWDGEVVAVSRSGVLPQPHFRGVVYPDYLPENAESLGLDGLVKLVKEHCRLLRDMSQNPGIAVDKLRPHTQKLWRGLSTEEKREFLSHHATRWNNVRHRIAQSIHHKVTDAFDIGRLRVVAGSIESVDPREEQIEVHLRDRDGNLSSIAGDLVVNCTGPQSSFSKIEAPFIQQLLARGLVRPDPLDMGIEATDGFAAVDAGGDSSDWLYAIGPLLKGSLWETTAVPEIPGAGRSGRPRSFERSAAIDCR